MPWKLNEKHMNIIISVDGEEDCEVCAWLKTFRVGI